MKKENIKMKAAVAILATAVISGKAIEVHDLIDHTKGICPVTKVMNIIPNFTHLKDGSYIPFGVEFHQIPEIVREYKDNGVSSVQVLYNYKDNSFTVSPEKRIIQIDEDRICESVSYQHDTNKSLPLYDDALVSKVLKIRGR